MIGWQIVGMRPQRKVRGRAFPSFIHNGSHYFSMLDVYSDGLVYCWKMLNLPQFRLKAETGWIAPQPPVGSKVSFHNFGEAQITAAEWQATAQDLVDLAAATVAELNPQDLELVDVEIGPRFPTAKRYYQEAAGGVTLGIEMPLFIRDGGDFIFTPCPVYADGTAMLWPDRPPEPIEAVIASLERGDLTMAPSDGAWIRINGLGQFRSSRPNWYVEPTERIREIRDTIDMLNGGPGTAHICMQHYKIYAADPSPANKARLRSAYDAVPEHLKMYADRYRPPADPPEQS